MLLPLLLTISSFALPPMEETLKKLEQDPDSFRRELPEKTGSHNQYILTPAMKRNYRAKFFNEQKEAPRSRDRAEMLVDNSASMERSLEKMETRGLMSANLTEIPWSDSYWPLYQGALGARYQDPFFDIENDWKKLFDHVKKESVSKLLSQGRAAELSPSEKYDLMMGDKKGTLTRRMWSEGEVYYRDRGQVESWMGLCHGWAAASFMIPTPKKPVMVKDPSGTHQFPLYVSDIKALGTLLYANANVQSRFIGGRCNDQSPQERDGRPVNDACRDTNPATWHLSVVNQIALAKRSFVLDATYDYQVWNQPVVSYEYLYFEPQTKKLARTLEEGKKLKKDFEDDQFSDYRAPKTKWIVGVMMDLTYVVENSADVHTSPSPRLRTVRYTYDLELDERGMIIGGEWYNNSHPDFLWVPEQEMSAQFFGNQLFDQWSPGFQPTELSSSMIEAYSQEGLPIGNIVDKVFEMSRD